MTGSVRLGLLAAYRQLLRPLVRILIRHGITLGEVNELLKTVFVEVASEDFALPSRKVSQSRVAILTGLTRKEVARQIDILESGDALKISSNLNRASRVLEGWHTDPEFTGPYGMPRELPFESVESGASFSDLVRKFSGDMAARAMLDELLRVRAVERTSSGAFRVLTRAYIPESFQPEALERFGERVRDYVGTYEFNMMRRHGPGRFERIVYAPHGLKAHLLPALDALIKAKGMQLLIELDTWISAQDTPITGDLDGHEKRLGTGIGIYHYVADENENR